MRPVLLLHAAGIIDLQVLHIKLICYLNFIAFLLTVTCSFVVRSYNNVLEFVPMRPFSGHEIQGDCEFK